MLHERFSELFARADIRINGSRPWDIRVLNERLYGRVLREGSLGLGEAYMDGWWECGAIDECVNRILRADLGTAIKESPGLFLFALRARMFNAGRKSRAFEIGRRHYDIAWDV